MRLNDPQEIDQLLADLARIQQAREAARQAKLRTPHDIRAEREWSRAVSIIRGGGGEAA